MKNFILFCHLKAGKSKFFYLQIYSNFRLRAGLRVGHFFVRVPALRIFLIRGLNLLPGGGVSQSLKIDKKLGDLKIYLFHVVDPK